MNRIAPKSAKLICGALLASVASVSMTESALADPGTINIDTAAIGGPNGNTYPGNPFSHFTGVHTFGGPPTILGTFFTQTVTSGLSASPDYDYELTVDYAGFDSSFFGGAGWSFIIDLTIADPDGDIGSAAVVDAQGNEYAGAIIDLGPDSIFVTVAADAVIAGGDIATIQWSLVPAPGALALFGAAGLVGVSRRRRS